MPGSPDGPRGVVVGGQNGWWRVQTPTGTLLCRLRGRLLPRGRERWRDIRDAEHAIASLDSDPDEDAPDLLEGAERVRGSKGRTGDADPLEPLPGDRVEYRHLGEGRGRIDRVLPRATVLDRPPIANCDHVAVVVSWGAPPFSAAFVDRVLVSAAASGCAGTVCLNKADLLSPEERLQADAAVEPWRRAGYGAILTSAESGEGLQALADALRGHLTVMAGPSGAGKSRLLHRLIPDRPRQSGALSARGGRGRHTTRAVELLPLEGAGWVADAPGFSRLSLEEVLVEELAALYPEFVRVSGDCRFRGCRHASEPDCAVRGAVAAGAIDPGRHARYLDLLAELEARAPKH